MMIGSHWESCGSNFVKWWVVHLGKVLFLWYISTHSCMLLALASHLAWWRVMPSQARGQVGGVPPWSLQRHHHPLSNDAV